MKPGNEFLLVVLCVKLSDGHCIRVGQTGGQTDRGGDRGDRLRDRWIDGVTRSRRGGRWDWAPNIFDLH